MGIRDNIYLFLNIQLREHKVELPKQKAIETALSDVRLLFCDFTKKTVITSAPGFYVLQKHILYSFIVI